MAIYRQIQMTFWTDPKVVDCFSPEDKYFYLYLCTNPHTNLCGCYEISIKQMVNETGYNKDTIEKLLSRFQKEYSTIKYSEETKEVLLLNWHKYNWTKSEKLAVPLRAQILEIKNMDFQAYLIGKFNGMYTVSIPYPYTIDTTVTVTVSDNTVPENVDTTDTVNKSDTHKADINAFFEKMWKLYPRKEGKGQVSDAKKKYLYENVGEDQFVRCIERYKKAKKGSDPKFILHGSTFFNSGYVDYLDENCEEKPTEKAADKHCATDGDAIREKYRQLCADFGFLDEHGSIYTFEAIDNVHRFPDDVQTWMRERYKIPS